MPTGVRARSPTVSVARVSALSLHPVARASKPAPSHTRRERSIRTDDRSDGGVLGPRPRPDAGPYGAADEDPAVSSP